MQSFKLYAYIIINFFFMFSQPILLLMTFFLLFSCFNLDLTVWREKEREKKRERETETHTHRQRERERDRENLYLTYLVTNSLTSQLYSCFDMVLCINANLICFPFWSVSMYNLFHDSLACKLPPQTSK